MNQKNLEKMTYHELIQHQEKLYKRAVDKGVVKSIHRLTKRVGEQSAIGRYNVEIGTGANKLKLFVNDATQTTEVVRIADSKVLLHTNQKLYVEGDWIDLVLSVDSKKEEVKKVDDVEEKCYKELIEKLKYTPLEEDDE